MAGYGTDAAFQAWLTENGHTLPAAAPLPAILRLRASNYIDGLYEARFLGDRTDPLNQERAWPRTGAVVQKVAVPSDVIPPAIDKAAYAAALFEGQNPGALFVSASSAGAIKREKVDVLETEYFQGTGDAAADATIKLSAVEGLLAPFLRPIVTGVSLGLWAVG
ncbi:DnaT-like ssDNA-binding protein [Brevundimonas sp.]|uniref:DnaT-like ssDNA-binding protein n=1 Tax=Brevundimonas sp. TaxID=1871086 RepID=UPI0025BABD58|nr:DnaT-like ssDNA-binding protein [Brevundimonas sp.]